MNLESRHSVACRVNTRLTRKGCRRAILVLVVVLTGCALTPSKPPDCEGPWTAINPTKTP